MTFSPYRSFFVVIFFPFRRSHTIMRINPENQAQLSKESVKFFVFPIAIFFISKTFSHETVVEIAGV